MDSGKERQGQLRKGLLAQFRSTSFPPPVECLGCATSVITCAVLSRYHSYPREASGLVEKNRHESDHHTEMTSVQSYSPVGY